LPHNVMGCLQHHVEQRRVAMLFGNTLAYSESALLMVGFIALVVWNTVNPTTLLAWCIAVLALQGAIQWLSYLYRQASDPKQNARRWGWLYAGLVALSGTAWGSGSFLLYVEDQPLLQAFVAVCLAGRGTASMLAHAYFPPALYTFATPIFVALTVRYISLGETANLAIGLMWLVFLGSVLLFGHRHARFIVDSILVRHENEQLVEELKRKNVAEERARVRAEQANLAKSRFFAAANHDLRQPLHSLGLFATTLRNTVAGREHRELVDHILEGIESLDTLFEDLLDISKLDAGQVRTKTEHFPAQAVLDRLRTTFSAAAASKGLRLRIRPTTAVVCSDQMLLFRVLSNLVANAIRYTQRDGVLVGVRRRGDLLTFEVWDTGIGIPADQHERIFEEFYQLHNPERDRRRGLGLGLATVRRIVQLLGCALSLRSVPGRGSVFVLKVPLGEAGRTDDAQTTREIVVPDLLRDRSIIVIDDEASVRFGMQSLLNSWGCRCVAGADAGEVLQRVDGHTPDFIIADLRLREGRSGIEAIRKCREQLGESIPAVLVSGDTATEQLIEVSASGLTMLHKPLKAVRLRALLNYTFAQKTASS
jgi:signal transduction histidine kinase/ActR/RegA family two-component response regulator